MSGTSLDGVDVVVLRTDGEHNVQLGPWLSTAYSDTERETLRNAVTRARTLEAPDGTDPAIAAAAAVPHALELVDRYGEAYPGERDAMRAAFLRSARLEHAFWEMCYTREEWSV
jgi:1,6-anhydro-N-acetylmuramate kinase